MKLIDVWGCAGAVLLAGWSASPAAAEALVRPSVHTISSQTVDVLIKLPLRNAGELEALTRLQSDPDSPLYRRFLSVAQFRARYAPLPQTVARAAAILEQNGLRVSAAGSQTLRASASARVVEHAFGARIAGATTDVRGRLRPLALTEPRLPSALGALDATLIGLGRQPVAQPQLRRVAARPQNRLSAVGPYWFDDLKQAYRFPAYGALNGRGRTIATVGLSDFSDADAALYFTHERLGGPLALAPAPTLRHVLLGGDAFEAQSFTAQEANVDVQQAAGSAPGATVVNIDVPPMGEGFLYGYSYIVDSNAYDIVSTSYNECELLFTAPYDDGIDSTALLRAYHDLFLQGNAQGITFVFSSGDAAGRPCPPAAYFNDAGAGLAFAAVPSTSEWADDPSVTAVGGTNLVTTSRSGSLGSSYLSEQAYSDVILGPVDPFGYGNSIVNARFGSGGGSSVVFAKPWYQYLVDTHASMRSVPDVAMHMGGCPQEWGIDGSALPVQCGNDSSAIGYVGGERYGFIGTSLAAPEFAGLLAVVEQAQGGGRMGNANGYLYRLAQRQARRAGVYFHTGIAGDNGVVRIAAGKAGYNPIVGLGTPIAADWLMRLVPLAGNPLTASNP